MSAVPATHAANPEREQFYKKIDQSSLRPLWEVLAGLVTKTPVTQCKPHIWHYDQVRPYIMEGGRLITAQEAERRVLVLENPSLRGQSRITNSLYAGLQLILPGEIAPPHRHAASALRFIVEGDGAYTAVDGEKTIMREGDFVLTPSWTWHDHGNDSGKPMVWMDGLDVPLVNQLETSFLEHMTEEKQSLGRPTGYSPTVYGNNVVPLGWEKRGRASPIFNYPYARTRDTLEQMRKFEEWDAYHGLKVQYIDPTSGDAPMPTIGAFMQLLPKGFKTAQYRSTDGTIYSPVEGKGRTIIGGEAFEWKKRDVFVVPSWMPHHHEADDEAVLFSFSDRPVQKKLGLWREQRGNEPVSGPH